ncbi:MAG: metallophosphoesterase [Candidatus Hydrogenedentota bacterium]
MRSIPARRVVWRLFAVTVLMAAAAAQEVLSPEQYPLLEGRWPDADDQKFSFAILGDKTSGGEGKWPIFDRAVDAINLLEPDFVITVGDQIPGHMEEREKWDAEWAEYLEHARRVEAPLVFIPGNHDIANVECYRFWKEDWGSTYFSFDYKGCHFLVLNTEEERFDGRGPVWEAMMEFAEEDLASHQDARHTFVFFHKPMWDDPRYEDDWNRVERAIGSRRHTVVAGHEHYLMTERRDGNLYVIQNATGGGIHLSEVREFGAFHGFGYVTVDGDDVTYAVIEPNGPVWPVDIAPASFRKAIAYEVLTWDAKAPPVKEGEAYRVRAVARFKNPFDGPIAIEARLPSLDEFLWEPVLEDGARWRREGDDLTAEVRLAPGQDIVRELAFRTTWDHLSYPPEYTFRVRYKGAWLQGESYPMEQEHVIPAYPVDSLRIVPAWQVVGPFAVGPIDTSKLPGDPASANANFFKHFGPEFGYDPEQQYDDGLRWRRVTNQGRGLLNFNGIFGTQDHALAYALCGVYSPEAQITHVVTYSDNFSQVVLNGELVQEGQDFGAPGGFAYVPAELEEGWNTLVVKLFNNRGDWFLRVLVADPEGNLEFRDAPPGGSPLDSCLRRNDDEGRVWCEPAGFLLAQE